jgi:small subunit ribosomal protein S20
MPTHKSAVKRIRQIEKRTVRNRAARSTFRTAVKKTEKFIADGDAGAAAAQLKETLKIIGKTEKKGLIHPNKAARHASRLTNKLNALNRKPEE